MLNAPSSAIGCLSIFLLSPAAGWAADTVEPFGAGVSSVELYVAGEAIGRRGAGGVTTTFQLGHGLSDRVSAYVNGSTTADTVADTSSSTLRLGLYATVVDSRHFDLDLFLDAGTSGDTGGVASGVELNLDAGRFGLFATVWQDLVEHAAPELAIGALLTVADGHQLLAAYDHAACAVATGYNVVLREGVELVNELACTIPKDGAAAVLSASTGILLTLP